jgi:MarR family transcriptional regulator, lower aerobic nicotinate degradation pathway regulator
MPRHPPSPDPITHILDALRRVTRHIRKADRQAEQRLGISGAQLFTLEQLGRSPAQSVNELAELTRTHQSSVSVVVSRLVQRGLAARRQAADDARRVELRITAAGQALLRRSPASPQARMIAALERMPSSAREKLAELLENMVREMGAAMEPAAMFFEDARSAPARARRRRRTSQR